MKTYSNDYTSTKRHKNQGHVNSYFIEKAHPAIISKEIFALVQREIKRRKLISLEKASFEKNYNKCTAYSHKYALGSVMECKHCEGKYRRQIWTTRGNRRVVWQCTNRLMNGVDACPDSETILETRIHECVVNAVNQMIGDRKIALENLKEKIEQLTLKQKGEYKIELINIINQLETEYSRILTENMDHGVEDVIGLKDKLALISSEIKKYKEELDTFDDYATMLKSDLIYYNYLKDGLENKSMVVLEYDESIVNDKISKIIVDKREVTIIFHNESRCSYNL